MFRGGGFFDPRDLLQLRYEMVRRHRVKNVPVAMTAQLFGVSLPTAHQAHAAFETAGLAGLLPKRRGPKQGHKLTPEILAHIERCRRERPDWGTGELLAELHRRFGLTIHRRSLERVFHGKKICRAAESGRVPARCRGLRDPSQRSAPCRLQARCRPPAPWSRGVAQWGRVLRGRPSAVVAAAKQAVIRGDREPQASACNCRGDHHSSD